MALTAADWKRLRKLMREVFRAEARSLLEDMIEGQVAQMGGYDGATEYKDDEWAEESETPKKRRRRIGFRAGKPSP